MSLIDDLDGVTRETGGNRCSLATWLETRPDDEVKAVRTAIANPDKPQRQIARVISANGLHISQSTIGAHRKNECVTCRSLTT